MPLDFSCIEKEMCVSNEGLTCLAFYVWNECPFIFQMNLLIIKSWILEEKVTFGLVKFCLAIPQIFVIFRKIVTWPQELPLSLKDGEICPCAEYRFNFIIVAKSIATKHFPLNKAPQRPLNTLRSKPLYIQWIVGDVFYKIRLILWV